MVWGTRFDPDIGEGLLAWPEQARKGSAAGTWPKTARHAIQRKGEGINMREEAYTRTPADEEVAFRMMDGVMSQTRGRDADWRVFRTANRRDRG
jgi:hypothetical protein